MRLVMGKMMKNGKLGLVVMGLWSLGMTVSCGPEYVEAFDPEKQLAIDIELIEEYLADQGYTEYDTVEGDIRMLVLDEGGGSDIEYSDIVSFHYIGRYLNQRIFDTSIESLALDQDINFALDTIFQTLKDDVTPVVDENGLSIIRKIVYEVGYTPVYSKTRDYQPYRVTHTQGGWAANQTYPSGSGGYVSGFAPSVHYALENCRLGGKILAFLPSGQAYGDIRTKGFENLRNTVLIFEITPIYKR